MKKIIIGKDEFEFEDESYNYIRNFLDGRGYSNYVYEESDGFIINQAGCEVVYAVLASIVVSYTDVLINNYSQIDAFNEIMKNYVDVAVSANKIAENKDYNRAIIMLEGLLLSMLSFSKKITQGTNR
jgi:hypothetical protein